MIIYLAGPMKGYPNKNFPAFMEATALLRGSGHRVYNPAEYPGNTDGTFDLRKAFASYATFICLEADTIVLLPGWEQSLGVSAELALAKNCGLKVLEWSYVEQVML
jgi:hypothetical protein